MDTAHTPGLAQIRRWAQRGTLPHALILSGAGAAEGARLAAAAMECRSGTERPCLSCRACRKVYGGIHPDVATADDPAHKTLSVDSIRRLCADVYIRPNEGERKVYIFPDCQRLTEQDQNVLLKIVEEGPPYAAFIFCTEHLELLLKTLRSRCVHLPLCAAGAQDPASLELSEAQALCQALLRGDRPGLVRLGVSLERRRMEREDLSALLEQAREYLAQQLRRRIASPEGGDEKGALSPRQMASAMETLRRCRRACGYNVGAGHVLGVLTVEWEAMI